MLSVIDLCVIVVYLIGTTLLGVWFGRGQRDQTDYFLGGRSLPAWALLLSIVATETSTVTFLSVPGKSFVEGGNFFLLQLTFGYILGRLAVIVILLPLHFAGRPITAYAVFEQKFGVSTRWVASLVFLLARTLGDGLRLFLTALALQVALDLPMEVCVLAIAVATAIYAFFGGVKSVVWNDCLQFFVYMGGALFVAYLLLSRLPGGLEQVVEFARDAGRSRVVDWQLFSPDGNVTIWSGVLGGAFLSLASHGADQLIVQRYLCAKDRRSAAWALGWSGPVVMLQFALFLAIGVALACYFQHFDPSQTTVAGDQALVSFVVRDVPAGIRGVILAAILAAAMSTLSSSVNSSASSLLDDLGAWWVRNWSNQATLAAARWTTLLFTVAQAAVAICAYRWGTERVIDQVLAIAGFAAGLLLGLYFLGLLVGRAESWQANVALVVGCVTTSLFLAYGYNHLWLPMVGSCSTLLTGLLLVALFGTDPRHQPTDTKTA